jgi:hypothetical protein
MPWVLTTNEDTTEFYAKSEEYGFEFVADSWKELYHYIDIAMAKVGDYEQS